MSTTVITGAIAESLTSGVGLSKRLSILASRWRQSFEFYRICAQLQALPDWVLHDIGVERSDIGDLATKLLCDSQRGERA